MGLLDYHNLKIIEAVSRSAYIDSQLENINLWNTASNGAITLGADYHAGHDKVSSFWNTSVNTVSRRDVDSNADFSFSNLSMDDENAIKINYHGGITWTLDEYKKMGDSDPSTFSLVAGRKIANDTAKYLIKNAVSSAVGALVTASDSPTYIGATARTEKKLTPKVFIEALRKRGDLLDGYKAIVMPSLVWYDYMEQHLDFTSQSVGDMVIATASAPTFNLPVIVSDAVGLSTGNLHNVLFLTDNAITINESEPSDLISDVDNSKDNMRWNMKMEGASTVNLKGYEFTGSSNPTEAELATNSNWTYKYQDPKAGVGTIVQVDLG